MSFGLLNALISFQSYIHKMLAKKLDVFIIDYLDNIPIYTEDKSQGHKEAIQWVLNFLKRYSLFANLKKSWVY